MFSVELKEKYIVWFSYVIAYMLNRLSILGKEPPSWTVKCKIYTCNMKTVS